MGCLRGSKFTCILFLSRVPGGPRVRVPRDLWSSLAAAVVVATARCFSETPRATRSCLRKTGFL